MGLLPTLLYQVIYKLWLVSQFVSWGQSGRLPDLTIFRDAGGFCHRRTKRHDHADARRVNHPVSFLRAQTFRPEGGVR